MSQSKKSSIIEILNGTLVTLAVTGTCQIVMPVVPAFIVSLVLSTALKYAIRRYYNRKHVSTEERRRLTRGLRDSAEGKVSYRGSFSKYVSVDDMNKGIDEALKERHDARK